MKIAVLGSAGSSLARAPFKDGKFDQWAEGKVQGLQRAHDSVPGDWDIWGCSPGCWAAIPRATRWFEVHRWEANVPWFSPEYCEFMRRFKGPVYTGGVVPEIPSHVVYPIDHIEEKFSSYFLTSSLALMIALAIDTIEQVRAARIAHRDGKAHLDSGVPNAVDPVVLPAFVDAAELEKPDSDDVIGLWGVDMAAADEYAYQRPGCQFFVLEAMRRDIGVYLPPESDLMRPMPVYGVSEWDHNYIKLTSRARELSAAGQRMQAQFNEAQQQMAGLQGEQHALQAFVSTWTSPYGMLPGMVIRQAEGTGLGSGITHFDGRPVSRMHVAASAPVVAAMSEPEDVQRMRQLVERILAYGVETGRQQLGVDGLLDTALSESETARKHSAILQPFVRAGESTVDVMRRMVEKGGPVAKEKRQGQGKGGKPRRK